MGRLAEWLALTIDVTRLSDRIATLCGEGIARLGRPLFDQLNQCETDIVIFVDQLAEIYRFASNLGEAYPDAATKAAASSVQVVERQGRTHLAALREILTAVKGSIVAISSS